jgi:hypothetical protein
MSRSRSFGAMGVGAIGCGASLWVIAAPLHEEKLPDSVTACRALSDATRLQCYDREVDRYQATPPATPGATPTVALPAAAAAPAVTAPATPALPPPAPVRQAMFKARIAALQFRRSGELVVTLDNGQVWTQYAAQEGKVPLVVGDTVTIRPGWLGTYLLVGPSSWLTKVHPVTGARP